MTSKSSKSVIQLFITCSIFSMFLSCATKDNNPFVSAIEQAHKKNIYSKQKATQFDAVISFGGNERLNGKFTLTNDSQHGKIELQSGEGILFIKDKVYASSSLDASKVRFDAYTWSYFFQFPYKLSDGGTVWADYTSETAGYNTKKLNFVSGTGDAPDDWYVVYTDPKTELIHHAAYIVTAHGGKEEAEKNPHAIEFSNYTEVDGIPFAQQWTFKNWNVTTGLGSDIGKTTLSNITFVNSIEDTFFAIPEGYVEVKN